MNALGGPLVCPKPRRIGRISGERGPSQLDLELVDIFLTKGGEQSVDSTPPFFCGSPPTRSANPIVNDARFGEVAVAPVNDFFLNPNPLTPAGCARTKFGFAPAPVRIDGFDCLDGNRTRGRGISAVA